MDAGAAYTVRNVNGTLVIRIEKPRQVSKVVFMFLVFGLNAALLLAIGVGIMLAGTSSASDTTATDMLTVIGLMLAFLVLGTAVSVGWLLARQSRGGEEIALDRDELRIRRWVAQFAWERRYRI